MTELTEQHIRAIYIDNGFPDDNPTLTNVGFRNRVYIGEHAVLKIYGDDNLRGYQMERWFYEASGLDCIPKLFAAGKNWILIERIHGTGLFRLWRELSDDAREAYVEKIAHIACAVSAVGLSGTASFLPYSDNYGSALLRDVERLAARLTEIGGIDSALLERTLSYIRRHADVFDDSRLYLVYNDLHFDNLIVTADGRVILLDFEMLEIAPKDLVLDVWQRMLIHPFTYANEDDHPHAHQKDYCNLLTWMQKYASELFSHPEVRRRVNLYAIRYELDLLCDFPNAAWPTERLEKYLCENLW